MHLLIFLVFKNSEEPPPIMELPVLEVLDLIVGPTVEPLVTGQCGTVSFNKVPRRPAVSMLL